MKKCATCRRQFGNPGIVFSCLLQTGAKKKVLKVNLVLGTISTIYTVVYQCMYRRDKRYRMSGRVDQFLCSCRLLLFVPAGDVKKKIFVLSITHAVFGRPCFPSRGERRPGWRIFLPLPT